MAEELNDYSGPYKADLTFADFSKDFLLKLMNVWQHAWLHMTECWYSAVKKRFGTDAANECEYEAWVTMGERVNPRYPKVANIQLNDITDCLKCMQLPLDNAFTSGLFPGHFEIKSKNLAVMTLSDCQSLRFFEDNDPDRINWVCPNEGKIMEKYLVHPKIKATAIKLPPRKSKDDIACVWEFRLED